MVKYKIFLVALIFSTALFGQNSPKQLFQLNSKGKAFHLILSDINNFIAGKSNGFIYPVSKVVISGNDNTNLEFEIKGIDNSWYNLFDLSEIPYGYMIVDSRLFVISCKNMNDALMANLFETTNVYKNFNMQAISSPVTSRNPKWHFQYKDRKYIWLGGEDMDVFQ